MYVPDKCNPVKAYGETAHRGDGTCYNCASQKRLADGVVYPVYHRGRMLDEVRFIWFCGYRCLLYTLTPWGSA